MGALNEPAPMQGAPISPMRIIQGLRWLGDMSDDEIIAAIQKGAATAQDRWPELSRAEVDDLQRQAAAMTKSRLRAWKGSERGAAKPTWLIVRALLSGLHDVME